MNSEGQLRDIVQAASIAFAAPFGGVLKLALDEDRAVLIDGNASPPNVSSDPAPSIQADCEWRAEPDILLSVLAGRRAIEKAFVSGRLSIAGDFSVMERLTLSAVR